MQEAVVKKWVKICIFNLFIVAGLGLIMRYKIAFEFPYFEQKNLLHAHSHFALYGWISLILMVLMVNNLGNQIPERIVRHFKVIFIASLICAYGIVVSFAMQGYGIFSIFFSTASLCLSFVFGGLYYNTTKYLVPSLGTKWFLTAIIYNIFSTAGVAYLSYMMVSKHIDQQLYLASVYWYLHFQYNGWFFFASIGLIISHLEYLKKNLKQERLIFRSLAFSCIPTYGLSVLWFDMPFWIFLLIISGAAVQLFGGYKLLSGLLSKEDISNLRLPMLAKLLLGISGLAFALKILLQTGSTIPSVSDLAFGFRPIVIAYLHLVLLGIFTLFIIGYIFTKGYLHYSGLFKFGIISFVSGVILNEILLAFQGIFSFGYIIIPFVNELLLLAAIILFGSVFIIILSQTYKKNTIDHSSVL